MIPYIVRIMNGAQIEENIRRQLCKKVDLALSVDMHVFTT